MAEVEKANRLRVWRSYCAGNFSGTYNTDVDTWQSVISRASVA
jgi:hypothetical protein